MPDNIQIKKRSIFISGHATSVTIEDEFWNELKNIAIKEGVSTNSLIAEIDKQTNGNLSSAIRLFVLKNLKQSLLQ